MKISKKTAILTAIVIAVAALSSGAFYAGLEYGRQSRQPEVAQLKKEVQEKDYESFSATTRNTELVSQYNGLVNDYNSLRGQVVKYVNANQYQSRQPINCTSNVLSTTVYTNCY